MRHVASEMNEYIMFEFYVSSSDLGIIRQHVGSYKTLVWYDFKPQKDNPSVTRIELNFPKDTKYSTDRNVRMIAEFLRPLEVFEIPLHQRKRDVTVSVPYMHDILNGNVAPAAPDTTITRSPHTTTITPSVTITKKPNGTAPRPRERGKPSVEKKPKIKRAKRSAQIQEASAHISPETLERIRNICIQSPDDRLKNT